MTASVSFLLFATCTVGFVFMGLYLDAATSYSFVSLLYLSPLSESNDISRSYPPGDMITTVGGSDHTVFITPFPSVSTHASLSTASTTLTVSSSVIQG